jgi:hypothetical protein
MTLDVFPQPPLRPLGVQPCLHGQLPFHLPSFRHLLSSPGESSEEPPYPCPLLWNNATARISASRISPPLSLFRYFPVSLVPRNFSCVAKLFPYANSSLYYGKSISVFLRPTTSATHNCRKNS